MSDAELLAKYEESCRKMGTLKLAARYADYEAALQEIAGLESATEIRGGLYDINVPDHMIKEGGWVPIPPAMKHGLMYAGQIAKKALEAK